MMSMVPIVKPWTVIFVREVSKFMVVDVRSYRPADGPKGRVVCDPPGFYGAEVSSTITDISSHIPFVHTPVNTVKVVLFL